MNKLITIIMPALNEEKRIEKALLSIRNQNINQEEIEILVIDGGSKDNTIQIANKYGVIIINNKKIVPEEAKLLGIQNAAGKYIIFMDADEELTDKDQFNKRIQLFNRNPEVKAILLDGYNTPVEYPNLTRYTNSFGDPFSFFIYRLDAENLTESLIKRKYKIKDVNEGKICYTKNCVIPIGDGGTTMIDLEYAKSNIDNITTDIDIATTLFYKVVSITNCFGIIKDDRINHYTTVLFRTLLRKIQFRVLVNLMPKENISGFAARAEKGTKMNNKKYLFPVYCFLFPIVLFESIYFSIKKKCAAFLLHFVFVYYTVFQIIFFGFFKIIGNLNVIKNMLHNKPSW